MHWALSTGRERPADEFGGCRDGPPRTSGRAARRSRLRGSRPSDRSSAVRSCESLLARRRARVGVETGSKCRGRVMKAGFHGAEGDAETFGDLRQWETDVVVEDDHGALLEREPPEGPLQLVAIVDRQESTSL